MTARGKEPLERVLGPLETEVMNIVWDLGDATVRDVHEALNSRRTIAYTTVMTTMGRLAEKGFLKKIEDRHAHVYSPLVSRQQYARSTVKSVVDWLIVQFREPTVAYLVDRVGRDDYELIETLREAIAQRERAHRDD